MSETGERVLLRYPSERDKDEFLHLRTISLAFFRPWATQTPQDVDDLYGPDSFEEYIESAQDRRIQQLLICSVDDGRILGAVKLRNITRGNEQYAVISTWVAAPHARKGYMTEGLQLAIRHAFLKLDLHRIEADIFPANLPSVALFARVGFKKEGIAYRFAKINGEWRDLDRYVLHVDDWENDHGSSAIAMV